MSRLAADSKISTQVSDREPTRLGQHDKAFFFSHYIGFVPWHTCHFSVTDVLVLTVTYVLVPYHPRYQVRASVSCENKLFKTGY